MAAFEGSDEKFGEICLNTVVSNVVFMAITSEVFKSCLSRFASGVTVVTTRDAGGNLHGLTVSAFSSLSLEPPLILICVHKKTGSHHAFDESKAFVVNVLCEDQRRISNRFASKTADKFEGIFYKKGIENIPVLEDCLANLECRLHDSFDGGDHTIFVGRIENAFVGNKNPLVYWHGCYRKLNLD